MYMYGRTLINSNTYVVHALCVSCHSSLSDGNAWAIHFHANYLFQVNKSPPRKRTVYSEYNTHTHTWIRSQNKSYIYIYVYAYRSSYVIIKICDQANPPLMASNLNSWTQSLCAECVYVVVYIRMCGGGQTNSPAHHRTAPPTPVQCILTTQLTRFAPALINVCKCTLNSHIYTYECIYIK